MKEDSKVQTSRKARKAADGSRKAPQDIQTILKTLEQRFAGSGNGDRGRRASAGWFIGIDLGDKKSVCCFLDREGKIVAEGKLSTTREEFAELFSKIPKMRIALEVGTHSPWVSEQLESSGHEVIVANPRKMESIHKNKRKNDKVDARTLARLMRADPELLYPIQHRGVEARNDLVMLRARDALVSARTDLINCVRGLVKSSGSRLPKCSAESFHKKAKDMLPEVLRPALAPVLAQIGSVTTRIRKYDQAVKRLSEKYPDARLLQQVKGVGDLTSVAYVLTLEKPERFAKSRDVGPYLGLVPKQDESGDSSKQLGITKTGDRMLRRLMVGSAHYILGPFGEDCDLRQFGLKLAARGGKNAKKRAVVAVARKLGVLLHRLWLTGEAYEPLRQKTPETNGLSSK
jgi:transposase